MTVDLAREKILDSLIKNKGPVNVRVTRDGDDNFRAAVTDALCMKAGTHIENAAQGAADYRHMSLRDLGIECLTRDGHADGELRRMSPSDLYDTLSRQFYNPASAFPAILDTTIRKSIVEIYNKIPTTFQNWTSKGSLSDFKESPDHEYLLGGGADFLEIPENGELKSDIPETKLLPTRKLKTYGRQFSMSRQAFINDDIGFITQVPGFYATKAKKTINKQVYQLLFDNPATYDGKAVFFEDHNNLISSGASPTNESVRNMILQMQKQTDPFGEPIYITPGSIIVPVGYGFTLATIFGSQTINTADNTQAYNPLYNSPINIIEEPYLNVLTGTGACPWFMAATPDSCRGIQVDYLNGQETPTIRRMETPGTLGFVWDIYLDWGISVRDYRGLVKNTGVSL
jgi:hypothetical protein